MEVVKNSKQVFPCSFNLSNPPNIDSSVTQSDCIQIYPGLSLTNSGNPITFNYLSSNLHYVDLKSAVIYMEGKIQKYDDKDLTTAENVTISEDIQAAIFSNCEFTVNAYPVYRSNAFYPFAVHYKNLVLESEIQKNAITAGLWYPDSTPGYSANNNTGYNTRKGITDLSKTCDFIRKPFVSMFDSPRPLPPSLDFALTYYRSADSFALCGSKPPSKSGSTVK